MKKWEFIAVVALTACLLPARWAAAQEAAGEAEVRAAIAQARQAPRETDEETVLSRNRQLQEVFRDYVQRRGGRATSEVIHHFNALVKGQGLITFDDFLAAMTQPVRYVNDPASGAKVPVYGALGSDTINPWLAAAAVIEQKPLEEQPMYQTAIRALQENVDFVVIGVRDPDLSLERLPAELRPNAEAAYRRLNPTNRFDGGFDHPLFYCVVREAAEKLFRVDHPQAKITMADLVVPESQGGFGIQSCLLCHERDHAGVYLRLLRQGMYLEAKAADLLAAKGDGPAASEEDPADLKREAQMFLLAAERVRENAPDKIDIAKVRQLLATEANGNVERLKPGYDDFVGALQRFDCLECHSSEARVSEESDPAQYGAYVLHSSAYHKTDNIVALAGLIDFQDVSKSRLLAKATNRLDHEGADRVKLSAAQAEELRLALRNWLESYRDE
jgi:hypothetical protein